MTTTKNSETAIFAGGCFWGVEYFMGKMKGVKSIKSGYIGGDVVSPSYEMVCRQNTGHAEAVRIIFDPEITDYETLAKTFFEIHDPTQIDGQGPDLGPQYRSEIFYTLDKQKLIAEKLIEQLNSQGLDIVTKISKATDFWAAEEYHQNYYERKGTQPYCHGYVKRFAGF
jgi:peptide methionine sulfoxide reductase msrA/msrB